MITLIGLLLSIKSTENHQRAKGQVMETPAYNENTKCLVFNTLTVWLKYQFNDTFEQEISVMLLTIFIETRTLFTPPKFCMNIAFDLSWDDCNTQEKMETMVTYFFLGGGRGEGGN